MRFPRLLLTLASVLLPSGFGPLMAQEGLPADAPKLYALLCASCHGPNLEGGLGGSLVDGAWNHGDGSDDYLARVITAGLPEAGMPGFGATLDAPRVRALSVFLRERAEREREKTVTYARPSGDVVVRGQAAAFRVETVVDGLEVPWSIAFPPQTKDLIIAERRGTLRLVRDGVLQAEPIAGTPAVWARGQGGLLVVQPHPDYQENGWLYLAYSDPGSRDGEAMTAIVRGRVRDGRWTDQEDIFRARPEHYSRSGVHYGCRLVFDRGYLFFGIGERGAQDQAQNLGRPNGKIHRLFDDGRVPPDNPFAGREDALPSIWSYGHRNPQGLVGRRVSADGELQLWETEHGPRGGDELNLVQRGGNHGWPLVTFGMNYNGTPVSPDTARPGLVAPVLHWTPSIAVCGLDFYRGDRFPGWQGDLLVGSLAQQELRRVTLDGDMVKSQEVLFRGLGRVRTVHTGPDGLVYVGLEDPGRVVRLVPAD